MIFLSLAGRPCRPLWCLRELRLGWSAVCRQQPSYKRRPLRASRNLSDATTGIAGSQSLVPLRASGMRSATFPCQAGYYGVMHYRHLLRDLKQGPSGIWPSATAVGWKAPHSPYDRVDGCRLRHRNPTGAAVRTLFSRRLLFRRPGEFRDRAAACPRRRTRQFPWFD